jgi:hypothetical protein
MANWDQDCHHGAKKGLDEDVKMNGGTIIYNWEEEKTMYLAFFHLCVHSTPRLSDDTWR